jgi:hypothetical protein
LISVPANKSLIAFISEIKRGEEFFHIVLENRRDGIALGERKVRDPNTCLREPNHRPRKIGQVVEVNLEFAARATGRYQTRSVFAFSLPTA